MKNSLSHSPFDYIEITGAREHNLKDIVVKIPKNKLTVITGISGSGKSSLAFETIYREGQRRYLESFSTYARQFIGGIERPDVDQITGLSPVISIEQKTVNKNPRSTVGTITEVYDFLRLLFAKVATPYSYLSGKPMEKFNESQIAQKIIEKFIHQKITITLPLIVARKGHYRELFEQLLKKGYTEVWIDGHFERLVPKMQVDRYKIHHIDVVLDKFTLNQDKEPRLLELIKKTFAQNKSTLRIFNKDNEFTYFSKNLMDIEHGISYPEPSSNTFSFNSPSGACPNCQGMGVFLLPDIDKMLKLDFSINDSGIDPLGAQNDAGIWKILTQLCKKLKIDMNAPIGNLSLSQRNQIIFGNESGQFDPNDLDMPNIANLVYKNYKNSQSPSIKKWAETYLSATTCDTCQGTRLKKESLYFKIDDKNIAQVTQMNIANALDWAKNLNNLLSDAQKKIAKDIIEEITNRLTFTHDVGLGYLTLDRQTRTLSGGEAQRIRLATQVGSKLEGVTYILDEPSIGLHQRDNQKLIESLKNLRDIGNTVIVVEHDKEIMESADYIIDIGPGAGSFGGQIVAQGAPKEFVKIKSSTANYLSGRVKIKLPEHYRKPNGFITLTGAKGNNLKNIDIKIPKGVLCLITGVSGSGKSSLINHTLYPYLAKSLYHAHTFPLPFDQIKGIEKIDKVINVDQSPIGRTPRSNPATYIKVFDAIRALYADTVESKIRGFKPGRFSFNVSGGRCEKCMGGGMVSVEMGFLPNILVPCDVCQTKRYNKETLDIRYKFHSISDVLNLSVEEAMNFFESIPSIFSKIKALNDVGLGYIKLGQSSTTLSGGEAQRVKLASELCKKDTGNTLYILDEPTTGLHFQDIEILFDVLDRLVEKGNSVLVIEHNIEVILKADYIIDMGPEGGDQGGQVVATGTPWDIAKNKKSITGKFLDESLLLKS
ncbi:MAG: excinuclease ABC subunit UvrA [Chitinophagales bacterium]|jgi:excinuclease ABC subunit A|nr:excinuclease ABC subunit UvrA [Chitinophagales bacterium]